MIHFKALLLNNWFKIFLVGILLFMLFKKDMSLQINMQAPLKTEQPNKPEATPVPKKEVLTERPTASQRQQLDIRLPFFGTSESTTDENTYNEEQARAFIQRFARVAVLERQKFGIPASIILANGLFQSQAGQNTASTQWNNYFNTPCSDDWQGETGTYAKHCLRSYENAWTSFRDHSFYLTSGRWQAPASLSPRDYKSWSKHLGKGPYSQQKNYSQQLNEIIKKYELSRFDVD